MLPNPGEFAAIELFRILGEIPLPADISGIAIRDAGGRPVAWRGKPFGLPPGPPDTLSTGISRSAIYRVLWGEVPIRDGDAVVGSVLTWSPFDLNYPLHNRYLRSGDFEAQVAERFGLADIDLATESPPPDPDPLKLSGPLTSRDGKSFAHITVKVFPSEVYAARIRHRGRGVRAGIVALVLAVLFVLAVRAALAPGASAVTLAALALLAVVGRWILFHAGFPALLFTGPSFDPAQFSHPTTLLGVPLGLLRSPADLVITGVFAVLLSMTGIRHFLSRPLRPGLPVAVSAAVITTAAAAAAASGWLMLVHLLPYSSTVEFFSRQTVLPDWPASLLLLGLTLLTIAIFAPIAAGFAIAARALAASTGRRRTALAAAAALPLFPAILVATDLSPALAGVEAVALELGAALVLAGPTVGFGLRVAALALLATLFTYFPFQREVWQEIRADVEEEAESLFEPAKENPLVDRLKADLTDLVKNPSLVGALTEDPDAERPQLAFRLWAESALARRPRGADIEILDRRRAKVLSRFDIDMPPRDWLPDALRGAAAEQQTVEVLPGVRGGLQQKVLVGSMPIHSFDGDFLGQLVVRMPVERPVLGPSSRPEILSSYGEDERPESLRELHYSEYEGDQLVSSTNPEYPRIRRAPPEVVRALTEDGLASTWTREDVAGTYWISLYRPRMTDGKVTGLMSVSFRSSDPVDLFLALFKLLLVNALAAFALALLHALPVAHRFVWRFQHKLFLSYLVISAVPVILLAELNRGLARETVEEQMRDSLRESVRLVRGELRDRGILEGLDLFVEPEVTRERVRAVVDDEKLKEIGYRLGQEVNLFIRGIADEWGATLVASSEPGIFATELVSDRLSGDAYREVVLLGRQFHTARESVGDYSFLVGYTPVPDGTGKPMGAISLPMIYGQDAVDRELASRNSLIIALYLLVLLVVFFIGAVLARRISSPIERLVEGTRRLSAGDLSYRIPHASQDEFGYLVDSFNRMTHDLEDTREQIVRAEKDAAWREMARQIAHEIKNPLTPMRLSAQHILRAWRDRHEDFETILDRGVDTIIRQTETLRRIAGEFSAFARLPQRTLAPTDPSVVVREVAALYVGTENVEVREELAPVPPVLADRDELRRVLVNLATNATQAMEGCGGVLTFRIRVVSTRFGGEERELVELAVVDTGVGIPPVDHERLFQPSFSTKTGGTGLGLAISKAVVESFGGEITVESEPGRGTTVAIQFPPASIGESSP